MQIQVTKGDALTDAVQIVRDDGSTASWTTPKLAPVPRDVVHHIIERLLGARFALWARAAAGETREEISRLPSERDASATELVQFERLAECLEADLWGGRVDGDTFRAVLANACAERSVPAMHVTDHQLDRLRHELLELRDRWAELTPGQALHLEW